MTCVVPIVEGHGEVAALPELLRRVTTWCSPHKYIEVSPPIRTTRSKFLNDDLEFRRKLQLAALKAGNDGWVLVLLDADDDCPVDLRDQILANAAKHIETANLSIVIANREYEAWFIAAASSLHGCRGFALNPDVAVADPDVPRDAKGWIGRQMDGGYHEVTDQPAMSATMDLEEAFLRSRSFQRFVAEFCRQVQSLA